MPTMTINYPTPTMSRLIDRLFTELAGRPPRPPIAPAALTAAGGADRPRCPLVMIQLWPHPRSPHLETAHFAGGSVVVPRGKFKDGELAVFVPEGARLPEYLLQRAGLWDYSTGYGTLRGPEGNRVAWQKVGGVLSYGVLLKALNDPCPDNVPSAVLFGPGGHFSTAKFFDHKQCAARFLGVE